MSERWDARPPDLLLATAQFFKERGALRPSISARLREVEERENINEEDVKEIIKQTKCTREQALQALKRYDNIAEAIISLKK